MRPSFTDCDPVRRAPGPLCEVAEGNRTPQSQDERQADKSRSLENELGLDIFVTPSVNFDGVYLGTILPPRGRIRFSQAEFGLDEDPDRLSECVCRLIWAARDAGHRSLVAVNATVELAAQRR